MNKLAKVFLTLCAALLMSLTPVSAYVEIVEQDDSYFVTDTAKVLDTATEQYIVEKNQLLNETSGASIVVVTVNLLNADIVDYAYTIFNEWKLGDETINNGILLLISTGDEDYYCMVGRGLENSLTSDELQNILDDYLEPDFASGNIQSGVRKVFDALYQYCVHLYNVNENSQNNAGSADVVFGSISMFFQIIETLILVFVVITVLVVVFSVLFRQRTVRRTYVPPVTMTPPPVHHRPSVPHMHRPSYPTTHRTPNRPAGHISRPSGFGSSSSRPSSSFKPRMGGSTRGAGAGRRR